MQKKIIAEGGIAGPRIGPALEKKIAANGARNPTSATGITIIPMRTLFTAASRFQPQFGQYGHFAANSVLL
jgi:hypothetical protein